MIKILTIVAECYEDSETRVVLMENHGTFVVGSDLYDLLYKAEVSENTARIAYLCTGFGEPVPFKYQKTIAYQNP